MNTPPDIVRTAYVELVVTDLARARAFWVDLVGFHVDGGGAGRLYLRGYEEFVHHWVLLRVGPPTACARIGFRVRTPDDLDRAERSSTTPAARCGGCRPGRHRGSARPSGPWTRSASPSSWCTR